MFTSPPASVPPAYRKLILRSSIIDSFLLTNKETDPTGYRQQEEENVQRPKANFANICPLLRCSKSSCGAAADSSSPILAIDIIRGTTRYSSIFMGLRRVVMPRIFMASRIAAYSSVTVGEETKHHGHGDYYFFGNMHPLHRCYKFTDGCGAYQIISHNKSGKHVRINPTAAPRIKFHVPVSSGNTVNSNANKIAYVTENLAAATHFLERSRNTIGHAMRHGRTRFINPPVPPVIIMVLTVTVKNSFVLGSVGITVLLSNFSVVTAASIRQSPPFQNVSSTRPCQETLPKCRR